MSELTSLLSVALVIYAWSTMKNLEKKELKEAKECKKGLKECSKDLK